MVTEGKLATPLLVNAFTSRCLLMLSPECACHKPYDSKQTGNSQDIGT